MTEPNDNHRASASPGDAAVDAQTDLDAKLAAEIEEALGDMSLDDMLEMSDKPRPPRAESRASAAPAPTKAERQRRTGTIMSVHGNDVFVEFGPRTQGVCSITAFPEPPALGAKMEFIVERVDRDDGMLILSREGKIQKAEWESLEVGQVVEARCTGVNKGGLEMQVANHRAFMPAGHVDLRHIADLNVYVGEKMSCEVIEIDRKRGRIILSRRSALEADRKHLREQLLATLEVGQTLPAVITSIQNYGAFADLGGLDGLIHISDLSYDRIKHPSEVVKEGQQVTVKVLKLDASQTPPRVGLGLKQTLEDPRAANIRALKEGQEVTGRITKLMPFGAFVQIAPGVEGLVHISELAHERVTDVRKVVREDEIVTVKVLSVDPASKKIALSLKATRQKQEEFQQRKDDNKMARLRDQLNKKFGAIPLKGGLG